MALAATAGSGGAGCQVARSHAPPLGGFVMWGNKAKRSDQGPKACQGPMLDTSLHACWDGDQAVGSAPCVCSGSTSPSRQEGQGALVPTPLCLG